MKKSNHHPLITGTLILTATGFLSRIIGFFYRIYLSRLFGEEGMGIYQLLNPVLSLSFSLTAAGYQTAISKLVAERAATDRSHSFQPLLAGLSISLPLSLLCNGIVYAFADPIADRLLGEPRTAMMLRILAFSIPLSAVHSCINGYFYGIKKAGLPAVAQLVEQVVRVASVYLTAGYCFAVGREPAIGIAALGLTIGEFFSMLVSLASIALCRGNAVPRIHTLRHSAAYGPLMQMALPLTANRIVLNLLQSVESVSIPARLRMYGYDNATALSVYGVLTGMAMPLIFFPNALTNSVAVMLLPIISESYALGDIAKVRSATLRTVRYCGLMGIACMLGFVLLGQWAGSVLFDSALAGHFIATLGFICPFLYLDTTLSSILQGLGMAGHIFVMNVFSLLIRLGFVFLAVPVCGITGYLWGILISQLAQTVLYLLCLRRFLQKAKY
ncbi:MAG: polysaccharide biosynthesis protein [Lachnospiraceae bacterium]|nr:polysaccharide biosynthesis protein [Butyrivibrio sp.]MCM1343437.1 polysaccharide biosynthesis protein [Muribaculaceae bacterium]MCM1412246.1 polysaccharide biosynthesis protein [Lachnospiraceae bacterium]